MIPDSTGNEYFLFQHVYSSSAYKESQLEKQQQQQHQSTTTTTSRRYGVSNHNKDDEDHDDIVDYAIWKMPLEERLENTSRHYDATEMSEFDMITDFNIDTAFHEFLIHGISLFLGARPIHHKQVDLLHIIAMVIHPQPSASNHIQQSLKIIEKKDYWTNKTNTLMKSLVAHSFHVNYGYRIRLIKMIVSSLVIPKLEDIEECVNSPLYDGAIPHLRASLHAFSQGAVSAYDAHWAHMALISIAIQSNDEITLQEEWEYMLHKVVDDRTNYNLQEQTGLSSSFLSGFWSWSHMVQRIQTSYDEDYNNHHNYRAIFCPHTSRGWLLSQFITKYCQSQQRKQNLSMHNNTTKNDDDEFLHQITSSIQDAIEWQLDCWIQPKTADEPTKNDPPCLISSLLFAAKALFYFLPITTRNEEKEKENGDRDKNDNGDDENYFNDNPASSIIECSIQLCHHWHGNVANEASTLLSIAFSHCSKESIPLYEESVFESIKVLIESCLNLPEQRENELSSQMVNPSNIESVVIIVARKSPKFASKLLKYLFQKLESRADVSKDDTDNRNVVATNRLVFAVSMANPGILSQNIEPIISLLRKDSIGEESRSYLLKALMTCRQTQFFAWKETQAAQELNKTMSDISNPWEMYKLAQYALVTGNYDIASTTFERVSYFSKSERYYSWLQILSNISQAELILSQEAALGIPSAVTKLRSAMSYLRPMRNNNCNFFFQENILSLRVEFLDLLVGTRQLIRETRITGKGPAKRTRSRLHFQNFVKSFDSLANRYHSLHQKFGLFICQQSRSSLRTIHYLCRYMTYILKLSFSDCIRSGGNAKSKILSSTSNSSSSKTSGKEKKNNALDTNSLPDLGPKGDPMLPITFFINRIHKMVIAGMSTNTELVIRAAVMLEIIDGILLTPIPFPRNFYVVRNISLATFKLSTNHPSSSPDESDHKNNIIETQTGTPFTFYASGTIPLSLINESEYLFSNLLLWYRVIPLGAFNDEDGTDKDYSMTTMSSSHKRGEPTVAKVGTSSAGDSNGKKSKKEKQQPQQQQGQKQQDHPNQDKKLMKRYTLITLDIFPNNNFFTSVDCKPIAEEGSYNIEVVLGCRDIRGFEWEIPVKKQTKKIHCIIPLHIRKPAS